MTAPRSDGIRVADRGTQLRFLFVDLLRYAGPGSPASLAMAYQAMRLSFPLLEGGKSLVRRDIGIETAYRGPGARDGFELVTRAVTEGRYLVAPALQRPERGVTLQKFVFRVAYHDQACILLVRPGMVDDEFMAMARTAERSEEDQRRFTKMKAQHMSRLLPPSPTKCLRSRGRKPLQEHRRPAGQMRSRKIRLPQSPGTRRTALARISRISRGGLGDHPAGPSRAPSGKPPKHL